MFRKAASKGKINCKNAVPFQTLHFKADVQLQRLSFKKTPSDGLINDTLRAPTFIWPTYKFEKERKKEINKEKEIERVKIEACRERERRFDWNILRLQTARQHYLP